MSSAQVGAHDAELLRAFCGAAAPAFPAIAQEFCESIRGHVAAPQALGEAQLSSCRASLVAWLEVVCGVPKIVGLQQEVSEVGRAEELTFGVQQRHLLIALSALRLSLLRAADRALKERAAPTREALNRSLDSEISIVLELYRERQARACQSEKVAAISKLVTELAHEIRNPLNGAQLHLLILERALDANEVESALNAAQIIGDELRRVASMLTSSLDIARPQPLLLDSLSLLELIWKDPS